MQSRGELELEGSCHMQADEHEKDARPLHAYSRLNFSEDCSVAVTSTATAGTSSAIDLLLDIHVALDGLGNGANY